MATSTTTARAIIAQMETNIRGLTPSLLASVPFVVARGERKFEEWCENNPAGCFRRYQIRDVGEYEAPPISNIDVEQLTTVLELTMAYPLAFSQYHTSALYHPGGIQDLEDVARSDMHQIRRAIGVCGYANYASGQLSAKEDGLTFEEGDNVLFSVMPFEVIFYYAAPTGSAFTDGFDTGFA